ncbi:hypothetical protein ACFL4L_06625 [bacterium]
MSKTAIKIETGLLGVVLILAVVLFGTGQAGNSPQNKDVYYYGGRVSSRVVEMIQMMHTEIRDASLLRLAEPNRMRFENKQGDLIEYSYAYNALWRNESPVIMNINAFHFEYRNDAGHALGNSNNGLLGIRAVMFVMRLSKEEQNILANGRIQIQPQYHSFHKASEQEMLMVDAN